LLAAERLSWLSRSPPRRSLHGSRSASGAFLSPRLTLSLGVHPPMPSSTDCVSSDMQKVETSFSNDAMPAEMLIVFPN
jgi:hypothetical protein